MRLRSESGFGLIELLMAMVILNVGILAIVAAFNAGIVTLNRASRISTGAALGNKTMEAYRALTYGCIYENSPPTTDSSYAGDAAYDATWGITTGASCTTPPPAASAAVTGADRKPYRVDTYVTWSCSTGSPSGSASSPQCTSSGSGRPVKTVTVVVRDGSHLSTRPYARVASTFDASTGS